MTTPPAPLSPAEIVSLLSGAMDAIRGEYGSLPGRLFAFRPGAEEWSILEVIGHLIEAEQRGFAGRIRLILQQEGRTLEAWDPDQVARERRDWEQDPGLLLGEFIRRREVSLQLVERLKPSDLAKGAVHPKVGPLTINEILHEWIHHDRNHLAQMAANVQAFTWPNMGNTQKFSAP